MRTIVALLVFVAVAFAVSPVLHADSPTAIPGSYIVILKDTLSVQARDAHILALKDTILAAADSSEVAQWTYNMKSFLGFSARLTDAMLQAELASPDVKYIEADQVITLSATVTQKDATWGLNRIDEVARQLDGLYTYNSTGGSGVDVYVIDTGILTTHVDFGGRATAVFNSITSEPSTDLNGHGTHCAGTVGGATYGVAKDVQLYAVKVLSASGSGTTAGVVAGVQYVTDHKSSSRPSIGSMSLGGGISTALDNAVAASIAAGIPYAIAAGNSNANACSFSPARVSTAVTVGATTNTDARASYSNFGTCVDIFAPGSSITSDWIGSNTAISTISGTSMATPHVAGVLAIHLGQYPSLSPAQASQWIVSVATSNLVTNPGAGSPNKLLYSPFA